MRLSALARGVSAVVTSVEELGQNDVVARRLRDVGFVAGEVVRMLPYGPLGGEPMLVMVGSTRFALRRAEADRVTVMDRQSV